MCEGPIEGKSQVSRDNSMTRYGKGWSDPGEEGGRTEGHAGECRRQDALPVVAHRQHKPPSTS